MKIPKQSDITSFFKCPRYPELKPITYKLCLGRQLTKLAGGGWQYPECVTCVTGVIITKHFEGYQLPVKKGAKPNWNTDVIMNANNKKKSQVSLSTIIPDLRNNIGGKGGRKSEPEINCKNCELKTLVKAQVNLILDLLIDNKLDAALRRLGLILEEL